jgi:hypothetical protein
MTAIHLQPGTVFADDFRVVRALKEGGMGAVYVAEQVSVGAPRALKLMQPQLVRDPIMRKRFEQESRIGARIQSDHVVQVVGAGVDDATRRPASPRSARDLQAALPRPRRRTSGWNCSSRT